MSQQHLTVGVHTDNGQLTPRPPWRPRMRLSVSRHLFRLSGEGRKGFSTDDSAARPSSLNGKVCTGQSLAEPALRRTGKKPCARDSDCASLVASVRDSHSREATATSYCEPTKQENPPGHSQCRSCLGEGHCRAGEDFWPWPCWVPRSGTFFSLHKNSPP